MKYITNFNTFLNDLNIQINPIQYDTAYKAAELRALYPGIKSMDALQLASSFITNCDIFLTNDTQLVQVKEVNVILLSDLDIAWLGKREDTMKKPVILYHPFFPRP